MYPVSTADARAHADAVLSALRSQLTDAQYQGSIYEGSGPTTPNDDVPYIVVWCSPGLPGGYPFTPGRDFTMTVSLRGVGLTVEQAQRAAIRGREVMLSGLVDVAGRRLVVIQDESTPPDAQRDDSVTPPLFSQLIVFDLRSDPA